MVLTDCTFYLKLSQVSYVESSCEHADQWFEFYFQLLSSFLFSHKGMFHRAQCFTKEKQYFELSHIPACSSLYWYPRGGCSCANGNNLPRWRSQKSIMPRTAWRTDTAQKHAMACGPLYIEPDHTSSAGTADADENICIKTFCSTLLEIFISFLVISCCFPIHIPFLSMTVNNAYMNAFLYAHDKIIS